MVMPDAINALLHLAQAPKEKLTRTVYNVTSFSLTAAQIQDQVLKAFPDAVVTVEPEYKRQQIVDSWPADMNDHDARRDWGWMPEYDVQRSFHEYLIPNIVNCYRK